MKYILLAINFLLVTDVDRCDNSIPVAPLRFEYKTLAGIDVAWLYEGYAERYTAMNGNVSPLNYTRSIDGKISTIKTMADSVSVGRVRGLSVNDVGYYIENTNLITNVTIYNFIDILGRDIYTNVEITSEIYISPVMSYFNNLTSTVFIATSSSFNNNITYNTESWELNSTRKYCDYIINTNDYSINSVGITTYTSEVVADAPGWKRVYYSFTDADIDVRHEGTNYTPTYDDNVGWYNNEWISKENYGSYCPNSVIISERQAGYYGFKLYPVFAFHYVQNGFMKKGNGSHGSQYSVVTKNVYSEASGYILGSCVTPRSINRCDIYIDNIEQTLRNILTNFRKAGYEDMRTISVPENTCEFYIHGYGWDYMTDYYSFTQYYNEYIDIKPLGLIYVMSDNTKWW